MKLIKIPSGSFLFGADKKKHEIKSFYMGDIPVSADIWNKTAAIADKKGYDICRATGDGKLSAGNITWYDAVKFCNALSELTGKKAVYYSCDTVYKNGISDDIAVSDGADGFRLPYECEWEYACKAGSDTRYFWGNGIDYSYTVRNDAQDSKNVIPKNPYELKPNPFGLYAMSGNVYEWCFSKHENFEKFRIMRGGSVALDSEVFSEKRNFCYPDYHLYETGIRLAADSPCVNFSFIENQNPDLSVLKSSDFLHSKMYTDENFLGLLKPEANIKNVEEYRDKFVAKIKKENKVKKLQWNIKLPPVCEVDKLLDVKYDDIVWFASEKNEEVLLRSVSYHSLYLMWEKTGDIKYFCKWTEYVNHKTNYYREQFDCLPYEAYSFKSSYGAPQAWECYMGFNDKGAEMLRYINNAVLKLSQSECEKYITPKLIKNVLLFCRYFNIEAIIKDSRSAVSNQMLFANKALIELSEVMNDFCDSDIWFELAVKRVFCEWLDRSFLPDGSDMEQSYNYNNSAVRDFAEISSVIKDRNPKGAEKLLEFACLRQRMLASVTKPFGGQPATGSMHDIYPPLINEKNKNWADRQIEYAIEENGNIHYDEITNRILKSFTSSGDNDVRFNSIVFPYGGYSVLRDKKEYDGMYLWFIFSRHGMGHCNENANAVNISAFGRNFLVSCGAESYRHPDFVPADQKGYIEQIDAYQRSSFGWNTVIADGMSQKRYINGETKWDGAYKDPIKSIFFTSDIFDYTEGAYSDGYGNKNTTVNASHKRRIYFVKPLKIWLIEDEMQSDAPHEYTQIWNFPPIITHEFSQSHHKPQAFFESEPNNYGIAGFYDEDIKIDEEKKTVYTAREGEPNLFMYHLTDEKLRYDRFFGELSPALGWLSPGFSGRRFPKTDIHVTWRQASLITLIAPSKNEISPVKAIERIGNSIRLETYAGSCIFAKGKYESEELSISARSVLIYENKGFVLGCEKFVYNGKSVKEYENFEFTHKNGKITQKCAEYPKGFKWLDIKGETDISTK